MTPKSPKQRVLNTPALLAAHSGIVDNAYFQTLAEMATLQMIKNAGTPAGPAETQVNAYRLQGAQIFLSTFIDLSDVQPEPVRKNPDALPHQI